MPATSSFDGTALSVSSPDPQRVAAILGCHEALGQRDLAHHLAYSTSLSVTDARTQLSRSRAAIGACWDDVIAEAGLDAASMKPLSDATAPQAAGTDHGWTEAMAHVNAESAHAGAAVDKAPGAKPGQPAKDHGWGDVVSDVNKQAGTKPA